VNSLSWMLYLAGVSGNIQGLLIGAAVLTGFAALFTTLAFFMTMDGYQSEEHAVFNKLARLAWPTCTVLALLASVIPSERTFYLIAASEMGERTLQLDTIGTATKTDK
jgi:putative Ca2+/H+ antiporter (TMEM165/GDT1 family)